MSRTMRIGEVKAGMTNREIKRLFKSNTRYKEIIEKVSNASSKNELENHFRAKDPLVYAFSRLLRELKRIPTQEEFVLAGMQMVVDHWKFKKQYFLLEDLDMMNALHNRLKRMYMGFVVEYQVKCILLEQIDDVIILRNPWIDARKGIDLFAVSINSGKIYNIHVTSEGKGMDYAAQKEMHGDRTFVTDVYITYHPYRDTDYSKIINQFPFVEVSHVVDQFEKWEADERFGKSMCESRLQDYMYDCDDNKGNSWELSVGRITHANEGKMDASILYFLRQIPERIKHGLDKQKIPQNL